MPNLDDGVAVAVSAALRLDSPEASGDAAKRAG